MSQRDRYLLTVPYVLQEKGLESDGKGNLGNQLHPRGLQMLGLFRNYTEPKDPSVSYLDHFGTKQQKKTYELNPSI